MAEDQNRTLQDKFMLRFPDGMRDEIRRCAEMFGRSMNSEIIQRLKRSLEEAYDERLKLDLPSDVWNALLNDAHIHKMEIEDRATQILSGAFDPQSDYAIVLDGLARSSSENMELEEQIAELRTQADNDFILYYNKAIQIHQFARTILASETAFPGQITQMARELLDLSASEIDTLKARYEHTLFKKNYEGHSRDLDHEIAENEDEEAFNPSENTAPHDQEQLEKIFEEGRKRRAEISERFFQWYRERYHPEADRDKKTSK